MINLNIDNVRKNLLKLLDYSDVSDKEFSNILGISDKQFRLIKSDIARFNIPNINKACEFFNTAFDSINGEDVPVGNYYREQLAEHHKNNPEYLLPLTRRPTIKHAIRFELLFNNLFKSKGMTVGEIKIVFEQRGWEYSSNYISTSLHRYHDLVKVIGIKTQRGKSIKVYSSN